MLVVTEVLEDWEDSVNIGEYLEVTSTPPASFPITLFLNPVSFLSTGRKREWFKIDDAIQVLRCHKPVQATYFDALQQGCLTSNGTPLVTSIGGDLSPTYNINQSSVSGIR